MKTKVRMEVVEHLHTRFDGSDCEYLDVLRTENPAIEIPLSRAFDLNA